MVVCLVACWMALLLQHGGSFDGIHCSSWPSGAAVIVAPSGCTGCFHQLPPHVPYNMPNRGSLHPGLPSDASLHLPAGIEHGSLALVSCILLVDRPHLPRLKFAMRLIVACSLAAVVCALQRV